MPSKEAIKKKRKKRKLKQREAEKARKQRHREHVEVLSNLSQEDRDLLGVVASELTSQLKSSEVIRLKPRPGVIVDVETASASELERKQKELSSEKHTTKLRENVKAAFCGTLQEAVTASK